MDHSQVAPIELITGISYLLILVGFGVRNVIESGSARLLWPWLLVSIFGLCGLTRLDYVSVINLNELVLTGLHLSLAVISLTYGVAQLVYACWPELFDEQPTEPETSLTPQGQAAAAAE